MELKSKQRRRRFKQQTSLQDRIAEWAVGVREQTDTMDPGPERDGLLKKLRQAETAMHLEDWAKSPRIAAAEVKTSRGGTNSIFLKVVQFRTSAISAWSYDTRYDRSLEGTPTLSKMPPG